MMDELIDLLEKHGWKKAEYDNRGYHCSNCYMKRNRRIVIMLSAEFQSVTIRINGYFANGHLGSEIKTYIEAFNYAFDTLFKVNGFDRCTPKEIKSIEGLAKKIKQYKRTYILLY